LRLDHLGILQAVALRQDRDFVWQSTDAAATACPESLLSTPPVSELDVSRHDVIYVCQLHTLNIRRQVSSKLPGALEACHPVRDGRLQLDYCLEAHPSRNPDKVSVLCVLYMFQ